jgi:hypothetical protein
MRMRVGVGVWIRAGDAVHRGTVVHLKGMGVRLRMGMRMGVRVEAVGLKVRHGRVDHDPLRVLLRMRVRVWVCMRLRGRRGRGGRGGSGGSERGERVLWLVDSG